MTYYFCTYLDQHYLPRGIALIRSLALHCRSFQLYVLCLDSASYAVLARLNLPHVKLIPLAEFEAHDPDLARVKGKRTPVEYYFTCTPCLPLYVLERNREIDLITYLDADLYFFADPTPVFQEFDKRSIGIIAHRFAPQVQYMIERGIYNVGWLSFRRDANGLACLQWWRERCLEWCHDRVEDNRYGDQKYLDDWPSRFANLAVIQHPGANLGPWNIANHRVERRARGLCVDDVPLLFYHFHGVKVLRGGLFQTNLLQYSVRATTAIRQGIYYPYLRALHRETQHLIAYLPRSTFQQSLRFPGSECEARPLLRPFVAGCLGRFGLSRNWSNQDFYLVF